jgi:hypothetical protein
MIRRTVLALMLVSLVVALTACNSAPAPAPEQPAAAPAAPAPPKPDEAKWTVTEGISAPESVFVDTATGDIYTSQIEGMPDKKDGMGHIEKLSADGKVTNAMWVTGLNAPKGLRAFNGTLWVADLDEVIGIDMAMGKITSRVKIPGAQFLNDVAVGDDGTVYVSDTFASRISAIKDGKVTTVASGPNFEYPNGLLVEGDKLVVGGWGKPEADFSTKVPGRLYTLDLKTKEKKLITPDPAGNFDGLESDGSGGYIVTDYNKGKLLHVSATGEIKEISSFMPGVADLAYLPAQHLAILPHMNENKIAAYDISAALQ